MAASQLRRTNFVNDRSIVGLASLHNANLVGSARILILNLISSHAGDFYGKASILQVQVFSTLH